MTPAETIQILAVLLIIAPPACYLAGWLHHRSARISRLNALRNEMRESRYAYLARLEAHRLAWKNWTDEAMRETQGDAK